MPPGRGGSFSDKQLMYLLDESFLEHILASTPPATIEKYLRDVRSFAAWLEGRPVSKELAARWKPAGGWCGFCP